MDTFTLFDLLPVGVVVLWAIITIPVEIAIFWAITQFWGLYDRIAHLLEDRGPAGQVAGFLFAQLVAALLDSTALQLAAFIWLLLIWEIEPVKIAESASVAGDDEAIILMLARLGFPVTISWFLLDLTVRYVSDKVTITLVLVALIGAILGDWYRLYPSFKCVIMKHLKQKRMTA